MIAKSSIFLFGFYQYSSKIFTAPEKQYLLPMFWDVPKCWSAFTPGERCHWLQKVLLEEHA